MSGVLKASSDATRVRRLTAAAVAHRPVPPSDPELGRLRIALSQADAQNDALRAELAALEERLPHVAETARKAGMAEGAKQATDDFARQADAVARAAEGAEAAWRERIAGIDALAVAVARAALAKLVGDAPDLADLVARVVAMRCRELDRRTTVAIRVSGRDFDDEVALARLAACAAIDIGRVVVDPDLPAGGCRIDLKLGGLDLDLDRQWRELDAFLGALTDPTDDR